VSGRPAHKSGFAAALIEWHRDHGRHDLPWQVSRTPYRVWVSEVMLQQTQVAAVIPYYNRFLERFPDIRALADAPIDAVLSLWSGLGYYARARHLHRAAVQIRNELRGELPRDFATLCRLPGIGRSTAGAILALSRGERFPILDGNAKRVLSRYFGVAGNTATPAVVNKLWELSERCTPQSQVDVYTQAIMDLGSTVCTRRRPLCDFCPLNAQCFARRTGTQHELPTPRATRARRGRSVYMLVAMRHDGSVLLERRPEHGLWGGLWCLPQFDSASAAGSYVAQSLCDAEQQLRELPGIEHAFTHFDLRIKPLLTRCGGHSGVMDTVPTLWYNIRAPISIGLPAPIRTLLESLASPTMFDSAATLA